MAEPRQCVNASALKVKLATAVIGIRSIHLLNTFINSDNYSDRVLIAQSVIPLSCCPRWRSPIPTRSCRV
jgi:uncharacterized membrane protein YqhA